MKYKIPVVWEMWGLMDIEADTLEDAIKYAQNLAPLPLGEYIEDSLEIDVDGMPIYNELENNA